MVVLGIDPGTANTGYGVVARRAGGWSRSTAGRSRPRRALDPGARLAIIHARVGELID